MILTDPALREWASMRQPAIEPPAARRVRARWRRLLTGGIRPPAVRRSVLNRTTQPSRG